MSAIGLEQLASKPENQAHGMTAVYLPAGVRAQDLLPKVLEKGVVIAGGLHREIKDRYVRVGHMGVSVMNESRGDVERVVEALRQGLVEVGYQLPEGKSS